MFFLILTYIFLLSIAYRLSRGNLASPSLHFIGGFFLSFIVALKYRTIWELNILHPSTYILLIGSSLVFLLVETLVSKGKNTKQQKQFQFIPIKNWKLCLLGGIHIIYIILMYRTIMSQVSMASDLSSALAELDYESKREQTDLVLPLYLNVLRSICQYGGFIWCCLFPIYYSQNEKYKWQKILTFVNLLLTIVASLASGSRGSIAPYIFATLIFGYITYSHKTNSGQKLKISMKYKMAVILLGIIFASLFGRFGQLLGREVESVELQDQQYLFAVYCGAQVKNLDDYITYENIKDEEILGRNTFRNIYKAMYKLTGEDMPPVKNNTGQFHSVNGWFTGNVRSALADYYADFRYFCFFVIALFSYIISKLFYYTKRSSFFDTGKPNIIILFYAYLAFTPALSFFGEKFYWRFYFPEMIRVAFAGFILIWFLFESNGISKNLSVRKY